MKKKLSITLIASLFLVNAASADFAFTEPSDYTGESFFSPASPNPIVKQEKSSSSSHTMPPIKKLRLKIKSKIKAKEEKKFELAPMPEDIYTGEIETSEYASKEVEEKFEDEISPDGFDSEEELTETEKPKRKLFSKKDKKSSSEPSENIILDCDNVDYDAPNYLVKANGNVNVHFVQQNITVKADVITFDRMNNTIKAEGDVKILKGGHTITGDYIFVDMNEENALIENPLTKSSSIEIKSKKGYVYGDRIVQEEGKISINGSHPIEFASARRGPQILRMYTPKNETLTEDMEKGVIKFKANDIKITQKGDLETVSISKLRIFKNDKIIFKHPRLTLYTNKNHDYAETGSWEVGAYRGLGVYAGPGFVVPLPKGSVLKAIPMLNYKSGLGVGALGRFSSGTNRTMAAYGTATERPIVYGTQELDDKLFLQYGVNGYMNEWFMGRRRPKYGVSLVYKDDYSTKNFLLKDKAAAFSHRLEAGYFHDLDFDRNFEDIKGSETGTTRFRYMAQGVQTLYSYNNEEELKAFSISAVTQLSSSLYGTGDTQVVGRIGPRMHIQYKRWMQDLGYFFSAIDDNTPMPRFDTYRYGKQNLYLREYFRICRFLTISWMGSINLTNDAPNGKDFQENGFWISIGPDDFKLNLGYDFVRENLYATVAVMMDTKGANVEYKTLEIKQDKKAKKEEKIQEDTVFKPSGPTVLQRAVVENLKEVEDVL